MPESNRQHIRDALATRYTVERELGAGGMATVYLAHDQKHDREVALKVLKPELAAIMGADRFLTEIRTTANLQHPHILPLFDSGEADGLLYFVMPYVRGESLRDRLDREGELPVEVAVRIATAVAEALDYAHRHGVVHRDIKPANILLHDGQPLVADFGIALALSAAGGGRLTETGVSLGTPYYMSPEQATAERAPDARSDVYSLGCVLYEMLTGEPPFQGHSPQAVLGKILTTDPVRPTEHRRSVPMHIEEAVLRALEKRPADRFASAEEFGEVLKSRSAAAHHMPQGGVLRPHVWRHLALGLGAATVVFAALTVWAWSAGRRELALSAVQHVPLALSDPPRGRTQFAAGAELAPDGGRIAYRATTLDWWILDLTEGTSRPLGIDALAVSFSPSGDSLAYTTSAYLQQLYLLDLATGQSTQLTDSVQGYPAWAEDGWIYYTKIPGVQRTRVADGLRETVIEPGEQERWYARNPVPLPGGRALLFTKIPLAPRNLAGAEIVALDLRTGRLGAVAIGVDAEYLESGHVLVAQLSGSLLAVPFDVESLEVKGSFTPVLNRLEIRQTPEVGASISMGSDGTLLYVEARDALEDTVVFVDRAGQPTRQVPNWDGSFPYTSFSLAYRERDQRWIASLHRDNSEPNIFVRAGDRAEPRRLTFSWIVDYYPLFVPNSDDVAFVSPTVDQNWDLYRAPFDGAGPVELVLDRPGDIHAPRFTADGRWVVFCEADRVGQRDIVAHRLQPDSVTVVLVGTGARECDPDVSPDGRWLVYTSDESGTSQVWVRGFEENADARWQVTRDGGVSPRWGRKGTELFYINSRRELIAVPLTLGNSFAWGSERALFELMDGWVWAGETASDDREFIMIRGRSEAPGQVMLIRNFPELIRRRAGG